MSMSIDTRDPFATTADPNAGTMDDLEFADPGSDFVEVAELDGRTICVFAKEVQIKAAKDPRPGKETYPCVIADVVVLDGPTTDKIDHVPFLVADMHLSATAVVAAVRGGVRTGKPIMGKIDSRPSRYNKNNPAYGLQPVDMATKQRYAPAVRQALAEGIN